MVRELLGVVLAEGRLDISRIEGLDVRRPMMRIEAGIRAEEIDGP